MPHLLKPEREDVRYVVSFQYTDEKFLSFIPDALRREDVRIVTLPGRGLWQGKTCVLAEISGAEGVQPVMADTAAGEASTVMPLPRAVQPADWPDVQAVRVTFDGITHFVMDRAQPDDALVQRAIAAAPEASAVGALFLDRAAGSMQPVVFVRETGSCVAETSCASGSVATAVVLTADFADGITEIGIGQPGGTLEVGVQRAHGAVTGLSIGGPVRLAQTLTVTLADAPC